ncbi:MAG: hypothetical protein ACM3S1_14590 [Hyphomicrobiales bacterium]
MSTLFPRFQVLAIAAVALALAALGAACAGDDDDDSSVPTGTATTTATATIPAEGADATTGPEYPTYPSDKETGIAGLDAVIDRVEEGQPLDDLFQFTRVSCGQVTASGSGDPPDCREGEAVGQVIDVLPTTTCERYYSRPDELAQLQANLFRGDPELFAVYRPAASEGTDAFPAGEYVAVFVNDEGQGRLVHVEADHVVRIGLGCGPDPHYLTEGQTDFVLPPLG